MASDRYTLKPDFLKEELLKIDEVWTAARFDSLPHVVHILTSRDREGEIQSLKEQHEIVEEVVDEVVHAYHTGFNKAIQNYSQILRLFSTSTECISTLKGDLAQAKRLLGARNKQLHQLWYRSLTLRHIIALLDQIEGLSTVPSRIEKFISEKQLYAAVQLHVQSTLMVEREGLQAVGALQDVRSELSKLRGVLFFKIVEELHNHIYNRGEYSSGGMEISQRNDAFPRSATFSASKNTSQPISRRTRSPRVHKHFGSSGLGDGPCHSGSMIGEHPYENGLKLADTGESGSSVTHLRTTESNFLAAEIKSSVCEVPTWLSNSAPDEFLEAIKRSNAQAHVKYLQTLVECLNMLDKVAAAGAILCQRLRPTIQEIITNRVKTHAAWLESSKQPVGHGTRSAARNGLHDMKGWLECYKVLKQKPQNRPSLVGALLVISPVSTEMQPKGLSQKAASELLTAIFDTVLQVLKNHIVVGELLEAKMRQRSEMHASEGSNGNPGMSPDVETSQVTGGYNLSSSLAVIQSECQQLICEILRATPDASSTDGAVQAARLASKVQKKDKRDGDDEGLSFAFRFMEASSSVSSQGGDMNQTWSKRSINVANDNYGTSAVLPEQGLYLAASIYRPVSQFTDKISSMLPHNHLLGNDGLQTFVENFLKERFLPAMFVDYWKCFQQALSNPVAFRPCAQTASTYTSFVEKGRPVLQGLLAIDLMAKEVLGWVQEIPKYAGELMEYVRTFLERAYERCRTCYMETVLEKQSYMLIGRHDIETLMRLDPAGACLLTSSAHVSRESDMAVSETVESETEMSDLLFSMRPIKQEHLIQDDYKIILLASLSDSLEYVANSIEGLGQTYATAPSKQEVDHTNRGHHHMPSRSTLPGSLASLADEYRRLSIDCLKVLRVEMQLETVFHMQKMTSKEYLDYEDADEPDDFIISMTAQILHRDESVTPFVARLKRNYIFGGVCSVAANAFIKALADMKSISVFGVQQICRNSISLEQALVVIPSIDSEVVQQRLDRVRTYYELLNLPFEALLMFIAEHECLFNEVEYLSLLKVHVHGREIPAEAEKRVAEILVH